MRFRLLFFGYPLLEILAAWLGLSAGEIGRLHDQGLIAGTSGK